MENLCKLQLEMNYDLLNSTREYKPIQVENVLDKLLSRFLYKGNDGFWYSKDKYEHERIYGTVVSLTSNNWFKKYVKTCKVYKEDNEVEDIVEQL